ncbi:hypothetical protein Glove_552g9 [Diversispora epigaea]|uniref:Uncharacterized protein n=1 Tax=Diversispora epigaea TaxID=1348612 RepID=A0A397GFD1_9GLOM|nr:hypothetical protein Glove_552g9 [Diversispora epigaea]
MDLPTGLSFCFDQLEILKENEEYLEKLNFEFEHLREIIISIDYQKNREINLNNKNNNNDNDASE